GCPVVPAAAEVSPALAALPDAGEPRPGRRVVRSHRRHLRPRLRSPAVGAQDRPPGPLEPLLEPGDRRRHPLLQPLAPVPARRVERVRAGARRPRLRQPDGDPLPPLAAPPLQRPLRRPADGVARDRHARGLPRLAGPGGLPGAGVGALARGALAVARPGALHPLARKDAAGALSRDRRRALGDLRLAARRPRRAADAGGAPRHGDPLARAAGELRHEPDRPCAERSRPPLPAGDLPRAGEPPGALPLRGQPLHGGDPSDPPSLPAGPLVPHPPPAAAHAEALCELRGAAVAGRQLHPSRQPRGPPAGARRPEAPRDAGRLFVLNPPADLDKRYPADYTSRSFAPAKPG